VKIVLLVVVLAVAGVFAYDGIQVSNAKRNVHNTAISAADAAATAIQKNPTNTGLGRKAADTAAHQQGDVVTDYRYDPVAAKVTLRVSGSASTLVLHYFSKHLTDDITQSATARP
jgi:Flp pilus assembly protein TadG